MTRALFLITLLTALAACDPGATGPATTARPAAPSATPPSSGLDPADMDTTSDPGDDFYRFANGGWLDRTEIPPERASYGAFVEVHERNEKRLKAVLEDAAAADAPAGSDLQLVGSFYASYMDEARADRLEIEPLSGLLAEIGSAQTHDDLLRLFGQFLRLGIEDPFGYYVDRDRGDTRRSLFYFWQGGLGLPDRDYYLKDDEKFVAIRAAYADYADTLLSLSGSADARTAADGILALETRLAEIHWPREKLRDRIATYNLNDRDGLASMVPGFEWSLYLEAAGLGSQEELVVGTPSFFTGFGQIFADTGLDLWRSYLRFKLLSSFAEQLSADYADAHFQFYGKTLRDKEQPLERWQYALSNINRVLGDALGRLYLERYFPDSARTRTEAMIENLRAAFRESMDELEWMSPETREEAKRKLEALTVYVGYPGTWREYAGLEMRPDDLVGNKMRGLQYDYEAKLRELAEGPRDGEFGLPTHVVNAYYRPTAGELVFLAGVLQPPFFDLDADDAINYGAIGAGIGHEMSHAFDDQGRKVDEKGENRDWWTPEDAERYEKRAAVLVDQFAQYEPIDGVPINGQLTLGENIADLAGLTIAYRAYRRSLDGREPPVIDGYTGDQRFFLGFARIWRTKTREGRLRELLLSDPHSPGQYRVIGTLSNMPEFHRAFDVGEGDALYRPPPDQVQIW